MRKILLSTIMIVCCAMFSFAQITQLYLRPAGDITGHNSTGIAVSNDGTRLYLGMRGAGDVPRIAIYDAATGMFTGTTLSGELPTNFGGDVAVDRHGAIYMSNVVVDNGTTFRVLRWASEADVATTFINVPLQNVANNRVGYAMDVYVDESGNGFLLAPSYDGHIHYWEIHNNAVVSHTPAIIAITGRNTVATFNQIQIVDKDHFWFDYRAQGGTPAGPVLGTMVRDNDDFAAPTAITIERAVTAPLTNDVAGVAEFTLGGIRYLAYASGFSASAAPNQNTFRFGMFANPSGVAFANNNIHTTASHGTATTGGGVWIMAVTAHVQNDTAVVYTLPFSNGLMATQFVAARTPVLTPAPGTYEGQVTITAITSETTDAVIRFTTDGSEPTGSSPIYTGDPITFNTIGTHTIRMLTTGAGVFNNISEAVYVVTGPEFTVTFDARGGTPEPAPAIVPEGGLIPRPANMEKAGYTFDGWFIGGQQLRSNTAGANFRTVAGDATAATIISLLPAGTRVLITETTMIGTAMWGRARLFIENPTGAAGAAGTGWYDGWIAFSVLPTFITEYATEWDFDNDVVTRDITLIAKWDVIPPHANIFASELSASELSAQNEIEFSYTLNADASSVTITVSNGDEFLITNAANLTKGSHTVTKTLTQLTDGSHAWSVTAVGIADKTNVRTSPAKFTNDDDNEMKFFTPRGGLAIDTNMDSPFFGRIYITESLGGTVDGRTTQDGIYILNAALQDVTNQGDAAHTGGVNWVLNAGNADFSPFRISVAADGRVFVPQYWGADHNIWIMDPANPTANFTPAFANADAQPRPIQAHLVGNDLFTMGHMAADGTVGATNSTFNLRIQRYANFSAGETVTGTAFRQFTGQEVIANNAGFVPDGNGGFWVAQNRAGDNEFSLMHFNAVGERTFGHNRFDGTLQVILGAVAYNQDRNLLAVGLNNNTVRIYDVTWNDGVPALGGFITTGTVGSVSGLAFDAANNLYVTSTTTRRLTGWAMPNATVADNTFTTQAPASQKITIGGITITDAQTPTITAQPQSATYNHNATAEALTVTANVTDGGTLTYQWYSNTENSNTGGTAIANATSASFTPSTATVGTVYYYVVITNTNNAVNGETTASVTSSAVAITVVAIVNAQTPTITAQPQSAVYNQNDTAEALTVTANVTDGGTLTYQWFSNTENSNTGGTAIADATSASFAPSTATVGTVYYYVVITNTNNAVNGETTASITSSAVAITVESGVGVSIPAINPLRAWTHNGMLHISGLTVGEMFSIYTTGGVQVYQGLAHGNEMEILFNLQGVHIVRQGLNAITIMAH